MKLLEMSKGRRLYPLHFLSSQDRHLREKIKYTVSTLDHKKDVVIDDLKVRIPFLTRKFIIFLYQKLYRLSSRFRVYKRGKTVIRNKGAVSFFLRNVSDYKTDIDIERPDADYTQTI